MANYDFDPEDDEPKRAKIPLPARRPVLAPFDPDVSGQKHFDFSPQGFQDFEDRRNEKWIPSHDIDPMYESSIREAAYRMHPGLRPNPAVLPPMPDEPSTPMAHALGRDDIYLLHHALNLLNLLGAK